MRGVSRLAAAALATIPVSLAAAGPLSVSAPPGSVVVWRGDGLRACEAGGERWAPIDGACWYPVDLLRPPGPYEVARELPTGRERATIRVGEYGYPVQRITIEDDSKVNLSARDLERVGREQELVGALWSRRGPARFRLPLADPLDELPPGGRFGHRRFFNDQPRSPHSGADFAAAEGRPVRAAADGTAVLVADLFFSGRSVFLDHGDGLITMYFHLSRIDVAQGAEVARGQTIGRVGQTGRATGPHLHFGVRWRGARVDPELLLGGIGRVSEIR
ncbi:MAG: M23 family metallopeptidase [Thermoanaerobaculia bacterium]|nr:M23 family metallopeptidase [Thermoanaerobaculia bacterium]